MERCASERACGAVCIAAQSSIPLAENLSVMASCRLDDGCVCANANRASRVALFLRPSTRSASVQQHQQHLFLHVAAHQIRVIDVLSHRGMRRVVFCAWRMHALESTHYRSTVRGQRVVVCPPITRASWPTAQSTFSCSAIPHCHCSFFQRACLDPPPLLPPNIFTSIFLTTASFHSLSPFPITPLHPFPLHPERNGHRPIADPL